MQEIIVGGTVMDDHLPNKCEIAIRSALSTCIDSNSVPSVAEASSPLAVSIRVRAEEKEEEKKEED
jgi:hypothetical protein